MTVSSFRNDLKKHKMFPVEMIVRKSFRAGNEFSGYPLFAHYKNYSRKYLVKGHDGLVLPLDRYYQTKIVFVSIPSNVATTNSRGNIPESNEQQAIISCLFGSVKDIKRERGY